VSSGIWEVDSVAHEREIDSHQLELVLQFVALSADRGTPSSKETGGLLR